MGCDRSWDLLLLLVGEVGTIGRILTILVCLQRYPETRPRQQAPFALDRQELGSYLDTTAKEE